MESCGLERVRLEPVMVPHWVRGAAEEASIVGRPGEAPIPLRVCALGGSVGDARRGDHRSRPRGPLVRRAPFRGRQGPGQDHLLQPGVRYVPLQPLLGLHGRGRPARGRGDRGGQGGGDRGPGPVHDLSARRLAPHRRDVLLAGSEQGPGGGPEHARGQSPERRARPRPGPPGPSEDELPDAPRRPLEQRPGRDRGTRTSRRGGGDRRTPR